MGSLIFHVYAIYKFQDSSIRGSRVSQLPKSVTDRQMDRRTGRPKPICPLNFEEVGGIKTSQANLKIHH